MKIETQVCTIEQAKKLKELGVIQDSQCYWRHDQVEHVDGVNSWSDQESLGEMIKHYDSKWSPDWRDEYEIYSAFTVAELGAMLSGKNGFPQKGWEDKYWYDHINGNHQKFKTEAEARAAVLIDLLERKVIKVAHVNQRLQTV